MFTCLFALMPVLFASPLTHAAVGAEPREQAADIVLANLTVEYTFRAATGCGLAGMRFGRPLAALPLSSACFSYYDHGDWKREAGPATEFVVVRQAVEKGPSQQTLVVVAESRRIRLTKTFTLRANEAVLRVKYDVESLIPHDIAWGYAPALELTQRADQWLWLQATERGGQVGQELVAGARAGEIGNQPWAIEGPVAGWYDATAKRGLLVAVEPGVHSCWLPLRAKERLSGYVSAACRIG